MEKLTRRFVAHNDGGVEFTICEYTDFIDVRTRGNPSATASGMKRLCTADGASVTRLEKGKYRLTTGVVVTSGDPSAP